MSYEEPRNNKKNTISSDVKKIRKAKRLLDDVAKEYGSIIWNIDNASMDCECNVLSFHTLINKAVRIKIARQILAELLK